MSNKIGTLLIEKHYTIKQVLKVLDDTAKGIVLVTDEEKRLLGTITDGDIRRALLEGKTLENTIEEIMKTNCVFSSVHKSKEELKELMIKRAIRQLPLVDDDNKVIDMVTINDLLLPRGKENTVVIMAGGLGTRLKNLTKEIPKPMLNVGDKPIIHHIIDNFKKYGYNKIVISLNYKAEIIENYFQDGFPFGVKINYVRERERLGTAGGIKLAGSYLDCPFFVVNGDIYTNMNMQDMMAFHLENAFDITVAVRKYSYDVPYGVLKVEGNEVKTLEEKPTVSYLINGGIYCLNPKVLKHIPKGEYFEITELINTCINNKLRVGSYEILDYWMDIGKLEDYHRVNEEIAAEKI